MSKPDFDVGDLVVCVDDGPHILHGCLPALSRRGQVMRVRLMLTPEETIGGIWSFRATGDADDGTSRACYRFRKIEKADDSFMQMLAACKPKELTR